MKVLLLAAMISTSVFAAQPKAGIYRADSTISMAPPRATHVLVQPNGDYWAADFYSATNDRGFFAQHDQVYFGNIPSGAKVPTAVNLGGGVAKPATLVATIPAADKLHLAFDGYVRPPMAKQGPFDPDLLLQPDVKGQFHVVSQAFTENPFYGTFSMNLSERRISGVWNSNCVFAGSIADKKLEWAAVTWTFKANCYAPDNVTQLRKDSKMTGVFFASTTTQSDGTDKPTPIYVLIMKTEDGKIGFSKAFYRKPDVNPR